MLPDDVQLDWRAALDALPEIAWLADANGELRFLNCAWREYTGADLAAGNEADALRVVHPDEQQAAAAAWHQCTAQGTPFERTLRLRRRDGVYHWFVSRARPIHEPDGTITAWSGTVINVHERLQAELEQQALARNLELERSRLRSIVDNVPVGLIFAEAPSGAIVGGNAQAEQIFGHALLPSPDIASYREWQGYHADGRRIEGHEYPLASALQGISMSAEMQYRRGDDGRMIWIRVSGAPLRGANGAITGGVIMIMDVDAEKRARDEQHSLLSSEQAARAEAEAAVGERDALIASITHDLKNPLTVIRGQVDLLRRRLPDATTPEGQVMARRLSQIDQTVLRMVAQIDELIDAARLRAGQRLELQHESVDMVELVERVVHAFAATTALHEIVWEPRVQRLLGVWDESRLERVFSNLLSNSIKYSPNGGVITVRVEQEQSGDTTSALVTVADQGIGIPKVDLSRVFELFARADGHVTAFAGAGIGLASARNIVQQHGGTIDVSSVEGSGSTFVVRLPLPEA